MQRARLMGNEELRKEHKRQDDGQVRAECGQGEQEACEEEEGGDNERGSEKG